MFSVRQRLIDPGVFQEVLSEGLDVLLFFAAGTHGYEQIDIADGVATAPKGARGGDRLYCRGRLRQFGMRKVGRELLRFVFCRADFEAAGGALRRFGSL